MNFWGKGGAKLKKNCFDTKHSSKLSKYIKNYLQVITPSKSFPHVQ